jgi:hypothetical protein
MRIEAAGNGQRPQDSAGPAIESLESRVLQAAGQEDAIQDSERPDPGFQWLYQQLLTMEGQGRTAIYDYLRSFPGADGTTPAYPTAKELLAITLQVLVRLTDDKLQDSLLYQEVSGANGLAFNLDLFVKNRLREVFQPMGDEAWEKSEW